MENFVISQKIKDAGGGRETGNLFGVALAHGLNN